MSDGGKIPDQMRPTATKTGNILLKRHERLCRSIDGLPSKISDDFVEGVVIPYRILAALAGTDHRRIGVPFTRSGGVVREESSTANHVARGQRVVGTTDDPLLRVAGVRVLAGGCPRCIACREYPPTILE